MTAQTKITPASGSVTDAARDLTGQCDRLTQALAERDARTARHRAQYFADAATHLPKEPVMAQTTPVPAKELIADIVGHLGAAVLLMPDTVEDAASLHIRQAHALVKQLRRASL